jgi:hypothetical protein
MQLDLIDLFYRKFTFPTQSTPTIPRYCNIVEATGDISGMAEWKPNRQAISSKINI